MQPVFVGDVQGCDAELEELLERLVARFGQDGFELWQVGDLVNRGPASLAVLERMRPWVDGGRARFVLGNHEIALLAVGLGLRDLEPRDSFGDVLESSDIGDWLDWLRSRPLLETGRFGKRRFAMLHAAAPPGVRLRSLAARVRGIEARLRASPASARELLGAKRSDPDKDLLGLLTRCRSIDARGEWDDAEPERPEDAWHRRWAEAHPDFAVVYGHWAMQGLHLAPGLRGLDTGCVHHGRGRDGHLTAWLPDLRAEDPFTLPERGAFWSVRARRAYYRELRERAGLADSA